MSDVNRSSALSVSPASRPTPLRRRWLDRVLLIVAAGCLAGLALRLTVRDADPPLSALFYATPLPVLTAGFALGAMRRKRSRLVRASFGLLACGLLAWTLQTYWLAHAPAEITGKRVRVLLWNTGRGSIGAPRAIASEITQADADIVVLVEAVPWEEPDVIRRFWRDATPQYRPSILGGGIVMLSRFPSGETITADLPVSSITRQLEVDCDGHPLTLLICDLGSSPFASRELILAEVTRAAELLTDRATLVLGDFNCPPDSRHFDPLRRSYRNVFETMGTGYLATWPVPLPVLSLDQMWVDRQIEIGSCRHLWTMQSDHRPVLAELGLP